MDNILNSDEYLKLLYNYIVSPIYNPLFKLLSEYFESCEDYIFSVLSRHETIFTSKHIGNLFELIFVPMILPGILALLALISILFVPRYFYTQFCRVNNARPSKHPRCFIFTVALTSLMAICLFLSATGSAIISIKLDTTLQNSLVTARNIGSNVQTEKTKFNFEINNVNNDILELLKEIEILMLELPENISEQLNNTIAPERKAIIKSYNEFMTKSGMFFELSRFDYQEEKLKNTIVLMKNFVNNIDRIETKLQNTTLNPEEEIMIRNDLENMKLYTKNFDGTYNFPQWNSEHLDKILNDLGEKLNTSIYFVNNYVPAIIKYMEPEQYNLEMMFNNMKTYMEDSLKILRNIISKFLPEDIKYYVKLFIVHIEYGFHYINQNRKLIGDFSASSLILLIPSLHCFLYGIFILFFCLLITCDLRNLFKTNIDEDTNCRDCSTAMLKVITLFNLSLLWTGLLLSTIYYTGVLPLYVICGPTLNGRLFIKYIDNIDVWSNKTWIDDVVQPWNHGYKFQEIVDRCENNITFYEAFQVEKYWSISDIFEKYQLNVDKRNLARSIENAIQTEPMPNGRLSTYARNNLSMIQTELNNFSPYIMTDLELFHNAKLKRITENLMKSLPDDFHEILQENLNCLNTIQKQDFSEVFRNFLEFKYVLELFQKDLLKIHDLELEINYKIRTNMRNLITEEIELMSDTINYFITDTKDELTAKIQNEIGNCYFIANNINIATDILCYELPTLLHMAWILHLLNSIILIICTFLCCSMINFMSGIQSERTLWRRRIEYDRQSEARRRVNDGTLLFDREGQYLGNSRTVLPIIYK